MEAFEPSTQTTTESSESSASTRFLNGNEGNDSVESIPHNVGSSEMYTREGGVLGGTVGNQSAENNSIMDFDVDNGYQTP